MERYGVIAGYPDRNFQGNRAITRAEFAVGLNAVLGRVNQLIATGLTQQVSRDDWAILERLQQEYAAQLATLQIRLDSLEARAAELKVNQFSTTTKLTGQTIFAVNGGGFSSERIVNPTGREITDVNPKTTLLYRTALDFNTSFFGTDILKVRLDTGSNGANDNVAGVLEPNFGSVLDFSVKPPRNGEFGIGRLYYTFTPFKDVQVSLGPAILPTDFIDQNSYANQNFSDFSTQALLNNYILFPINGESSGAALDWKSKDGLFSVRAIYVAADAANPGDRGTVAGVSPLSRLLYPSGGGNRGLFGDPDQGIVELEYAPSKAFALRLQYSGGNVFDHHFDVFGANFELAVSRRLGIFGRYGYGIYDDTAFGDLEPNYWMAGVSFRNLFVPGAVAGIAAGQPLIESKVGNATQTNFEAFYNFPLSDNFGITPLVQVITNPANQDNNGTIVTGTLRTVFLF
jgi:porin